MRVFASLFTDSLTDLYDFSSLFNCSLTHSLRWLLLFSFVAGRIAKVIERVLSPLSRGGFVFDALKKMLRKYLFSIFFA